MLVTLNPFSPPQHSPLPVHPSQTPKAVTVTRTMEDFEALHAPSIDAVLWQRTLSPSIQSGLDSVAALDCEDARLRVTLNDVRKGVMSALTDRDLTLTPALQWLVDDIAALTQRFAAITKARELELRLEWIDHNACPRFHRDNVSARLLCTYSGPVTEYGLTPEDGPMPERIYATPTASPILLKGKLWPDACQKPLIHRSPLIEGTGAKRLMLAINPPLLPV